MWFGFRRFASEQRPRAYASTRSGSQTAPGTSVLLGRGGPRAETRTLQSHSPSTHASTQPLRASSSGNQGRYFQGFGSVPSSLSASFCANRALKNKWQEKSELISKMEREVVQMRDSFVAKETKLTEERDKAIAAGKWVLFVNCSSGQSTLLARAGFFKARLG